MLLFVAFIYVLIIILMIIEDSFETTIIKSTSIIAHRGASGYAPENTMISFEKALELNSDFIEMDIQMTKDGELIVIHDTTINRTTNGTGSVKNFLLKDIEKFDAGSWFHPSFSGEKIPTLKKVFDRFAIKTGLLLELKDPHLYPGVEKKLASLIKQNGLSNNKSIIVQSFDVHSIFQFHQLLPNIQAALLTKSIPSREKISQYSSFLKYLNTNFLATDMDFFNQLKKKDIKSFVWTINNLESYHLISSYDIDGIVTDYPDLIQQAEKENKIPIEENNFLSFIKTAYQVFLDIFNKE